VIRINLVRKEKKGFKLPDISRLKQIDLKSFLMSSGVLVLPALFLAGFVMELIYAKRLSDQISSLEIDLDRLTSKRNSLKKKAELINAEIERLEAQIREVRGRIQYLRMSRDVILALKGYYTQFNGSLEFLRDSAPTTVWFDGLTQHLEFDRVDVDLRLGSYDLDSIKDFFERIKLEFSEIVPGEINKRENKNGMIYYVASVKVGKRFTEERDGKSVR
jgi:hypothetical protein